MGHPFGIIVDKYFHMDKLSIVSNNFNNYFRITLILFSFVFSISCCPKDGVDKSREDSAYNITLDIVNQNNQQPIVSLDHESKISIVLDNGARLDSLYFSQDTDFPNRYTFFFDSSITDELVSTLEVKLIDYQDQKLNYKTVSKVPFQKGPTLIATNGWDRFFCELNPMDWILPKANALSCKSKNGSKISWRAGYRIVLGLYPETY